MKMVNNMAGSLPVREQLQLEWGGAYIKREGERGL